MGVRRVLASIDGGGKQLVVSLPQSPELKAAIAAFTAPTTSRHDALLHDLLLLVEDVGNLAADQGWQHLEYRCDSLFVRLRRELEG